MKRLISISVTTILWTEGNHAWFDVWLAPGTSIEVHWGDGHVSKHHYAKNIICRPDHYYKNLKVTASYQIEFYSEDENAIVCLVDGTWEMHVDKLIVENCPGLKALTYHQLYGIDLSGCQNLEYLDIQDAAFDSLDFSLFPKLHKLMCKGSNFKVLDLSKNPGIEELGYMFCHSLTKIKLPNNSNLRLANIPKYVPLDKHSRLWLQKTIERNGGRLVDWVDADYTSVGMMYK